MLSYVVEFQNKSTKFHYKVQRFPSRVHLRCRLKRHQQKNTYENDSKKTHLHRGRTHVHCRSVLQEGHYNPVQQHDYGKRH